MTNKVSDEYLAGLLDGEGCFRITRNKRSHGPLYYCSVAIRMRDDASDFLTGIADQFESYIYVESANSKWVKESENRHGSVMVEWRGPKAVSICNRVLPFLVLKHNQAEKLIEFEALRLRSREQMTSRGNMGGSGGRRLPKSYFVEAEKLYLQCRKLKEYKNAA